MERVILCEYSLQGVSGRRRWYHMSGRNLQLLTSYRIDPNVIYSGSVDIVKVEYNTKLHH